MKKLNIITLLFAITCISSSSFSQSKKKQIEQLTESIDSLNAVLSNERISFETLINQKKSEINTIELLIQQKDNEVKQKSSEITELEILIKQKDKEIETKSEKVKELEKRNNDLEDRIKQIEQSSEKYLIGIGSVGPFIVGKPVPSSTSGFVLNRKTIMRQTDEGEEKVIIESISENNTESLHLEYAFDYESNKFINKIEQITVLSTHFKTDKDVGVGTSIDEFLSKYPNSVIGYSYISGRFWIEANNNYKIQFELNDSDYIGKGNIGLSDYDVLKRSDFKKNAVISKIRLF